ncbi:hypothetical protein ACLSU7_11610 [Bdellovibrio sp. HCB185ZH]|uniref:hypothetical protein n=1 Tax=Bdellovibrio sp. HCB185ZH TaxID=3394235 RepID=UPI0039A61030
MKFKLRDSYLEFEITNRHNRPLIFENRGSYLRFHFCDHSGVVLQNLIDTGTAGTFYFQEGHMVALRSIKKEPFCSITIRLKGNIQEKVKVSYSVIEKKADFRQLPKFTGVRFWYGNNSPGEVVQEISCYTPVINPKQTEYDSLTGQDLAYAFHTNLVY